MPPHIRTIAGICAWHERNMPGLIEELRKLPAEQLSRPVECDGESDCAMAALVSFLMHTAHHHGQLSVYLRGMGAKVPPIYGGSADEPFSRPCGPFVKN